jgi:hypothetical protein
MVVVLYSHNLAALVFPSLEQLERVIGARPIATLDDGVIAAVPPQ